MKKVVIGLMVGAVLALITVYAFHVHHEEKKQEKDVLETKLIATKLHRNLPKLQYETAFHAVERLEERIVTQEGELSPGDEQLQHWLDQSHELLIMIHDELSLLKKEPLDELPKSPKYYL